MKYKKTRTQSSGFSAYTHICVSSNLNKYILFFIKFKAFFWIFYDIYCIYRQFF
jgi:hypothetical protein